jgi:hypothetical protein
MSTWYCPNCNQKHDYGDCPDILEGMKYAGSVWAECDCGYEFQMDVDFEPYFYVRTETMRKKQTQLT